MKKILVSLAAITLSLGLVAAIGGVATAHGSGSAHGPAKGAGHRPASGTSHGPGNHRPVAVVAIGSTTCNVHGTVVFDSTGNVTFKGNVTPLRGRACSSSGGTKLRVGHFSRPLSSSVTPTTTTTTTTSTTTTTTSTTTTTTTLVGSGTTTTTTVSCTPLPSGTLPDLSGGTIRWAPGPMVAPSVGISLSGGSASTITVGSNQYLQVTYSAGSVASGSFTNASGASLTLTSNQTVAELQSRCSSGNTVIAFHGTITL